MQNPFALAVQWPDEPCRYLVHLQKPYFTAPIVKTRNGIGLWVSWASGALSGCVRDELFQAAAAFCRQQLGWDAAPVGFAERQAGFHLPTYLLARTPNEVAFIVEPDHVSPLVEVREHSTAVAPGKPKTRFDHITQWRLAEMRQYYRRFLEREALFISSGPAMNAK
jgi:hypothetical protein